MALSKIKKNHISGMSHQPYSPEINPCDFWLFGMFEADPERSRVFLE
jgi:hypothetical protein